MTIDLTVLFNNLKSLDPNDQTNYNSRDWRNCLIGIALRHGFFKQYGARLDKIKSGVILFDENENIVQRCSIYDFVSKFFSNQEKEFFLEHFSYETFSQGLARFEKFLIDKNYFEEEVEPIQAANTNLSVKMEMLTKIVKFLEDNHIRDFNITSIMNDPKIEITL